MSKKEFLDVLTVRSPVHSQWQAEDKKSKRMVVLSIGTQIGTAGLI